MTESAVGRIIAGRYEILSPIDEGGMGRVYVALQRSLNRKVALKLILPGLSSGERAVKRFLIEAETASQLNHPNVVSIYDFGQSSDRDVPELFLVMELLSGSTLRALLDSQVVLPLEKMIDLLCQLLAGLAEAHERGITHRDVKPENIFLQPRRRGGDHLKLIDFGLAKLERRQSVTLPGQFVGTPFYSAPELVENEPSPVSDLYSVGAILYQMLTGEVPFDSPSLVELLILHRTEPRPDPTLRAHPGLRVPRALADVCMRAMAISPVDRFPTAEAMSDALQAIEAVLASDPPTLVDKHPPVTTPPDGPISGFGQVDSVAPGQPSVVPPTVPTATSTSPRAESVARKVVLVVEDDDAVRKLLAHMLRSRYEVYEAEDGLAAAALLEQIPLPDLILCDVMMPRMDGLALARYLKSQNSLRSIPIIFLSARDEAKDIISAIQAGARHYLTKPVQMKDLLERVARTLGET